MTGYQYNLNIANLTGETPEFRRAYMACSYFANPVSQGDYLDLECNGKRVECEVKTVRHAAGRNCSTIDAVTHISNTEFDEIFAGFMQPDASQPLRR